METDPPFVDRVRALANDCFERYYSMTSRSLDSETPRHNLEAWMLIQTGWPFAIRDAQIAGNVALAEHLTRLLAEARRHDAYVWLHGLACDGRGRDNFQPIGDVVRPIVARAAAK